MRRPRLSWLESLGPAEPQGKESDPSPPHLCIRRDPSRGQKLHAQEEAAQTNRWVVRPHLRGASDGVRRSKTPSTGELCLNVGKEPYTGETGEAELPHVAPPPH
jgi:hypothetical protein